MRKTLITTTLPGALWSIPLHASPGEMAPAPLPQINKIGFQYWMNQSVSLNAPLQHQINKGSYSVLGLGR
ncbi:hypothetical protein [Shewanella marisflavi]|uniref:Uncharacterized protein n=1 Tax=Shewanella marisflavi TaxID=260364 RepID=A0AAC9U323_9GAMM|nr:hypothetical protein [Shewanella marisflavi]ASJ98069.1 hypothetical protein CFF01_16540 [Shewanella marisflavi]MCL1040104.1 hypothetical protein [Shewanella marisflavi]